MIIPQSSNIMFRVLALYCGWSKGDERGKPPLWVHTNLNNWSWDTRSFSKETVL